MEKYVPPDHQNDRFYERFTEQRARDLNNSSTTDEHDSLPFPIEPSQSTPSQNQRKLLDTHGSDSGVKSPLAFSPSPVLPPSNPIDTSTPLPSTSRPPQAAQLSPKGPFSPIQQFIRSTAKLCSKEPKYNRSQANQPDPQSVLRTRKRQAYKL